ncbi:MAG: TetR/AcrR family transcriptional regulator [Clostridiales Family XIII bacterium]|nr:TetR/AcrR family transcriptional regulator [Clostridiales Family XIII bacterium]
MENQEEAKKMRIVNAAISEFARHGYKNANTNDIVKEAGVSKGLLFHYFGSKKQLYVYLYEYAMRLITDAVADEFDWEERDIFKRWRTGAAIKLRMMREHGMLFEFIIDAYARTANEVKEEIDTSTGVWMAFNWDQLMKSADTSLFRDDIDVGKAMQVIWWSINACTQKWVDPTQNVSYYEENYASLTVELDAYLELLRRVFYKEQV